MTTSQFFRKSAHRARWLSTGHRRARPDVRQSSQVAGQLVECDANRSFVSRFTVVQHVASARSKSASSLAALKSP